MRIKFNMDHNGVEGGETKAYKKGQEYDVPDERRALLYVRSGVAKPANAEARHAAEATGAAAEAGKPAAKK